MNKDIYFLNIAKEISKASKCLSRKIGAILVKDGCIISTGYNGPPRNVKHCNERIFDFYCNLNNSLDNHFDPLRYPNICPRKLLNYSSGQGLHLCQAGHAERNALIQAARNGISTLNSNLYAYCPLPCKDCVIELINGGIKEIICLKGNDYDNYARILIKESNITLKEIDTTLL